MCSSSGCISCDRWFMALGEASLSPTLGEILRVSLQHCSYWGVVFADVLAPYLLAPFGV
jgi:hypothetical protein